MAREKNAEDEALAQLRNLLLGPEQKTISTLQDELGALKRGTLEIHAQDLSEILPEAVALRPKPDKKLTQALMPTVEESLDASIKQDPQRIVDAISPVMMPAIRKAIGQALSRMVQSLNQTLEHGLSPRSLKWRFEALRTGKPFAEVVLLHTLIYRVEQVFLIHRETGLLLQHVVADGNPTQDADMVSAMLTAIRDFVHDSFGVPTDDSVEALQVGELTVWVEQGRHAILAAVIHGNAPQNLREVLQDVLAAIHLAYRKALESFDGDTSTFIESRSLLQPVLVSETTRPKSKAPILLWLLAVIVTGGVGYWFFLFLREQGNWADYVRRLEAEEGIVVTHTGRRDGKYFVSGLRDEFAPHPQTLLSQTQLPPEKVISEWEPYQALSPKFVLTRAQRLLQPPETVTLTFADGVLTAQGVSTEQWRTETEAFSRFVPGVVRFQADRLVDAKHLDDLTALRTQIEETLVNFGVGTDGLDREAEVVLEQLAKTIQGLIDTSQAVGIGAQIQAVGRTSSDGAEETNTKLREARANRVVAELTARGVRPDTLSAIADDNLLREEVTENDKALNRSVSFRVRFSDVPETIRKALQP